MRYEHRLRALHMCVRGHCRRTRGFRLIHELAQELAQLLRNRIDLRAHI